MRIDVKKWLFVGIQKEKTSFFKEAQKLGLIEFIEKEKGLNRSTQGEVQLYLNAIKVLRGLPPQEQEEATYDIEPKSIASKIVNLQKELDHLEEDIRLDLLEEQRISPLGNFSLEDLRFIEEKSGKKIQIFCGRKGRHEGIDQLEEVVYITSDPSLDYFIALNDLPKSYPGLIEMKITSSLSEVKERIERAKIKSRGITLHLQGMAKYDRLLREALQSSLNHTNLKQAENTASAPLEGALFSCVGWVPENHADKLNALARHHTIHMEEVAIAAEDKIPTYLENKRGARLGEDLIDIYDTPSTTDKDPSLWVLAAFVIYFSIIIGDGGYGLLLLALALYFRFRYPFLQGVKKRVLNLATLLSIGCIIWGVMTASFFGLSFEPNHPIRKLSVLGYFAEKKAEYQKKHNTATYQEWVKQYPAISQASSGWDILQNGSEQKGEAITYPLFFTLTDQILMEFALVLGVVHLFLGMIRYARKNWSQMGWALFLLGGFLYIPAYLNTPSFVNYLLGVPLAAAGQAGLQIMGVGVPLAVILSIFRNGVSGLAEIMNVIQVFADTLSYLRLYALGLSGAILGSTINEMASALPFLPAVLLIGAGHMVNIALALMGGVIHGLRLNFIEWYHYSFEGGGKKFHPLQFIPKY